MFIRKDVIDNEKEIIIALLEEISLLKSSYLAIQSPDHALNYISDNGIDSYINLVIDDVFDMNDTEEIEAFKLELFIFLSNPNIFQRHWLNVAILNQHVARAKNSKDRKKYYDIISSVLVKSDEQSDSCNYINEEKISDLFDIQFMDDFFPNRNILTSGLLSVNALKLNFPHLSCSIKVGIINDYSINTADSGVTTSELVLTTTSDLLQSEAGTVYDYVNNVDINTNRDVQHDLNHLKNVTKEFVINKIDGENKDYISSDSCIYSADKYLKHNIDKILWSNCITTIQSFRSILARIVKDRMVSVPLPIDQLYQVKLSSKLYEIIFINKMNEQQDKIEYEHKYLNVLYNWSDISLSDLVTKFRNGEDILLSRYSSEVQMKNAQEQIGQDVLSIKRVHN